MDSFIGSFRSGVSPTCDYITGKYLEENQVYTYEIIDQLGRLMENDSFLSYKIINLSDYMNGLYFVIVKNNKTVVGTFNITKY